MAEWIDEGELAVAGDVTTADLLKNPTSLSQAAVRDLVDPMVDERVGSDPSIIAAGEAAAAAAIASADLVLGSDSRLPLRYDDRHDRARDQDGFIATDARPDGSVVVAGAAHRPSGHDRAVDASGFVSLDARQDGTVIIAGELIKPNPDWDRLVDRDGFFIGRRLKDNVSFPAATATSTITGRHRVVVVGQSLGSNNSFPTSAVLDTPHPRVYQVGSKVRTLRVATSPMDFHDNSTGISPLFLWAKKRILEVQPTEVVEFYPTSQGGAGWASANSAGTYDPAYSGPYPNLYTQALTQISDGAALAASAFPGAAVLSNTIVVVTGQADASAGVSEATHAAMQETVIAGLRAALGDASAAVVFVGMVPEWIEASPTAREPIQRAILSAPARISRSSVVKLTRNAYDTIDPLYPLIHMDREGAQYVADRLTDARERAVFNDTSLSLNPPAGLSARLIGTALTATVTPSKGPATEYVFELSTNAGTSWTSSAGRPSALDPDYSATVTGPVLVRARTALTVGGSTTYSPYTTPITPIGA
ncbi:hypothetical protein N1031_06975 [Herbiconiux moechotypicola]|uniref:Sialate O-acetylesterase domain-containing protein n=1 Tax=Herbiconiux moechotypicola TaxID=637393 RepID=A0ABN3DG30_9MICO|nr:hypothetical protein [Herbiconiux moechotypicola]MCS5729499.1 hypothetical protein [Herbiconiux moechotypicola]